MKSKDKDNFTTFTQLSERLANKARKLQVLSEVKEGIESSKGTTTQELKPKKGSILNSIRLKCKNTKNEEDIITDSKKSLPIESQESSTKPKISNIAGKPEVHSSRQSSSDNFARKNNLTVKLSRPRNEITLTSKKDDTNIAVLKRTPKLLKTNSEVPIVSHNKQSENDSGGAEKITDKVQDKPQETSENPSKKSESQEQKDLNQNSDNIMPIQPIPEVTKVVLKITSKEKNLNKRFLSKSTGKLLSSSTSSWSSSIIPKTKFTRIESDNLNSMEIIKENKENEEKVHFNRSMSPPKFSISKRILIKTLSTNRVFTVRSH